MVDGPRWRALAQRVGALGFADLPAYLAARYAQDGCSLAGLAAELGTSTHTVAGAMDACGVAREPAPRARGRARRAASDRRLAARVAALGFADVGAYLADRDVGRGWSIPRLAGELGVGRRVVRRVLAEQQVPRTRITAAGLAAVARPGGRGGAARGAAARTAGRARFGELRG
ncbi:MAG TPA: hypothetical protein VG276_09670 [Actinomycetes bacterium]|nr:hypothetical protein [Actinomycetes bacterium]